MDTRSKSAAEGLYVHVPFCDGKCRYCAFYSVAAVPALVRRYLAAAEVELRLRTRDIPGAMAPRTVYVGGGTPVLLPAAALRRLCRTIAARIDRTRLAEWTVEANPGTLTPAKARILAAEGVTRISIGAQSFHDASLRLLGRRHTAADAARAVAAARAAGFRNLGLDLIACVPEPAAAARGRRGASPAFRFSLERAVSLGPEHVSVYALTLEEGTRLAAAAGAGGFAPLDDDRQLDELHLAERLLTRAGYARYEISNYARPGFECLHNLSCWRGETYLGIGPAAASHAEGERWTNAPDLAAWLDALEAGRPPVTERETLTPESDLTDRVIFGLRAAEGIDLDAIRRETGAPAAFAQRKALTLQRLGREGLVRLAAGRWRLTPRGRDLADHVGRELLDDASSAG